MPSLSLLIGPNAYAVRMEALRWIREFRALHGDENLRRLSSDVSLKELRDEVNIGPFISTRRMVMVDGVPRFGREDLKTLLSDIHPAAVLVLVAPAPDRRIAFVKELLKVSDVREFLKLSPLELRRWMKEQALGHGATFHPDAIESLLAKVGDDQEILAVEIAKLSVGHVEIRPENVSDLVIESGERVWWNLTILLGEGKVEEALMECRRLLLRGESPHALWARLLWIVASLAEIVSALGDAASGPVEIAKVTNVKPGTARTLLPLAKRMREDDLRRILDRFTRDDIAMKTGGYRATSDETQEIEALIDLGILAFGK